MAITLHPPQVTDWRGPVAMLVAALAGAALVAASIVVVQNITEDDAPATPLDRSITATIDRSAGAGITASYPGTIGAPVVVADLAPGSGVTASYPGALGAPVAAVDLSPASGVTGSYPGNGSPAAIDSTAGNTGGAVAGGLASRQLGNPASVPFGVR